MRQWLERAVAALRELDGHEVPAALRRSDRGSGWRSRGPRRSVSCSQSLTDPVVRAQHRDVERADHPAPTTSTPGAWAASPATVSAAGGIVARSRYSNRFVPSLTWLTRGSAGTGKSTAARRPAFSRSSLTVSSRAPPVPGHEALLVRDVGIDHDPARAAARGPPKPVTAATSAMAAGGLHGGLRSGRGTPALAAQPALAGGRAPRPRWRPASYRLTSAGRSPSTRGVRMPAERAVVLADEVAQVDAVAGGRRSGWGRRGHATVPDEPAARGGVDALAEAQLLELRGETPVASASSGCMVAELALEDEPGRHALQNTRDAPGDSG